MLHLQLCMISSRMFHRCAVWREKFEDQDPTGCFSNYQFNVLVVPQNTIGSAVMWAFWVTAAAVFRGKALKKITSYCNKLAGEKSGALHLSWQTFPLCNSPNSGQQCKMHMNHNNWNYTQIYHEFRQNSFRKSNKLNVTFGFPSSINCWWLIHRVEQQLIYQDKKRLVTITFTHVLD